jgi:hypothetical protein
MDLRLERAGSALHPGEIVHLFRYRNTGGGATMTVSRSGIVRQVRPARPPGGLPRLGAGPPLPRHSSGSNALKPVSSAA